MRQMKLGTKIALGFGLLIVIAIFLGGVAVWQMRGVTTIAEKLANEYMPEVGIANQLERNYLLTRLEVRGYALSEKKEYLDSGRKYLEPVREAITEGKELAAKYPALVKLKEKIGEAEAAVKEYESSVDQTAQRNEALAQNRRNMDEGAAKYMKESTDFLVTQNQAMEKEFNEGASPEKLKERLNKITWVNDVIDMGNGLRVANFRAQALRNPVLLQENMKNFEAIEKKLEDLRAVTRQEANLRQIEAIKAAGNAYKQAINDLMGNWLALEEIDKKRGEIGKQLAGISQATAEAGMTNTVDLTNEVSSSLSLASTIMLVGLVVALVVGILLAVFITRSITKPVNRIIEALNSGAAQVSAASGQVSSASQSLAEGASEQAAGVEETSSSLEEMSSMTKQNADNASQANSLMDESKAVVSKAGDSMKQMTKSMDEISNSGQEISKIIKTIDEIAFQTNLLALNAAVEAARAGEAGAGFAVVADEVRNLAQRAAEAAKNTANLIEETIKKISQGTDLVKTADEAFVEVANNANKVAELVGEIAAASTEQAQGIEQINQAVTQMDKVTQQNAANAEESASASEELNAQAESMMEVVGDLMALVGGAAASNAMRHADYSARPKHGPAKPLARPAIAQKRRAAGAEAGPPAKIVKADEVIPMDEDFKDF